MSGTYPGTLSNAVETLSGDNTGVTISATSNSTSPSGTGLITFTIFTDEAGEWTITRYGAQEYLFYMDFSYQYQYLADGYGVYVGTYEIDAEDSWTKTIKSLPLYIYDDAGNVIGYYSYYVEEVSPSSDNYDVSMTYTLQVDGTIISKMELDPNNSDQVIVTYLDKTTGAESTYSAKYTELIYDGTTIVAATLATDYLTAMSEGSVLISNKVKETAVVMPESGGTGTNKYIFSGLAMCLFAGLMIYIRSKRLQV